MNRSDYCRYIAAAAELGRRRQEAETAAWREAYRHDGFLGMYRPPGHLPVQAQLEGFLFRETGDRSCGERAVRLLLEIDEYKRLVTEEECAAFPEYERGVPSFEPCFQGTHYMNGYLSVKGSGLLNAAQTAQIEEAIRTSIEAMLHTPEWGAQNRAMLRVYALSLAIASIGETRETGEWIKFRDRLALESIGGWSIEDSEMYLPLWLLSCIGYAGHALDEREYYAKPQTRYYFDYMARLIAPYGQIPDYGDAHHHSHWYMWLACLEKGAAQYRCGTMKYAARKVLEYGLLIEGPKPSVYVAAFFAHACLWGDDGIAPVRPVTGSEQLLEELIGKKFAYRDGWEEDSVYLLYTYRDEGPYARIPRDYLRTTIDAPAEKVHHGHADENSVSLLVRGRNILLHDGGYRDRAPNGKYRADLYHNRLVFRSGEWDGRDSLYDFLHDDGAYKPVATEKLIFHDFGPVVYGRTRLTDNVRRLIWDRSVTFLKAEGAFIVVDWTRRDRTAGAEALTAANLWHPGTVLASGAGFYAGQVRRIHRYPGDGKPLENRSEWALLIEFPGSVRRMGAETIRRCYADSEMVYEASALSAGGGAMNGFVTVLTPYRTAAESAEEVRGRVEAVFSDNRDTLSLSYRRPGGMTALFAHKLDLTLGLAAGGGYPRYDLDGGLIAYGALRSDADFAYTLAPLSGQSQYGLLNGCALLADGRELFRARRNSSFQFATGLWATAEHKRGVWDGTY